MTGVAQLGTEALHAERMRRLGNANAIRTARSRVREGIAVGKEDAAALLLDPPAYVAKVKILDFLTWLPKVGKTRARGMIRQIEQTTLLETTPICKLSPSTRERLAVVIRSRQR